MTNKEIREKVMPDTAPHMGFILDEDLELLQNETRKSERERVIGEMEKWLSEGSEITRIYTQSNIQSKLNKLK